jgi:hypothetical protein
MNLLINRGKKGALELSISTVVVIVIGMSMLILGLVLVRTIFTSSIGSVNAIDEGVKNEIEGLFQNDGSDLIIKLGADNVAKVKPGNRFNVAFGAQHPDGDSVQSGSILFRIKLDENTNDNCLQKLGQRETEDLFKTRLDTWNSISPFRGPNSFDLVEIDVPKGTERCTQKVNLEVRLKDSTDPYEGDFFLLEVTKEGIF